MAPACVGGFPASSWASLFQSYPRLLLLLQLWVSQELERFFGVGSFRVFMLTRMILDALPVYGLEEGVLVAVLQPDLRSHALEFVRRLVEAAEEQCGDEAQRLLIREGSRAAGGLENSRRNMECSADFRWWREVSPVASTSWTACQERREGNIVRRITSSGCQDRGEWSTTTSITCSARPRGWEPSLEPSAAACAVGTPVPRAAPSSSAAAAGADTVPSTSTAALQGGPGCGPAPTPAEQEDAQQEPAQAVPRAPAPRQGRACSRQRPRCTRKRKAGSSEDAAAPAKKPPRQ